MATLAAPSPTHTRHAFGAVSSARANALPLQQLAPKNDLPKSRTGARQPSRASQLSQPRATPSTPELKSAQKQGTRIRVFADDNASASQHYGIKPESEPEPELEPAPESEPEPRRRVKIQSPQQQYQTEDDDRSAPGLPSALVSLHHRHTTPAPQTSLPIPPKPCSLSARALAASLPPPTLPPHRVPSPVSTSYAATETTLLNRLRSLAPPPPPTRQTRPRRAPFPQTTLKSFTLPKFLPQISHHSAMHVLHLFPPTHLTLYLRSTPNLLFTIRVDGGNITVLERAEERETSFALDEMPVKYLPAYRYARRCVEHLLPRTLVAVAEMRGGTGGKLWGDGHAEIRLSSLPSPIRFLPGAHFDPSQRRELVEEERQLALEMYRWLCEHPQPKDQDQEKEEWGVEIDEHTAFVRGVGWCREVAERKEWRMRFLDGVVLVVRKGGREVEWKSPGENKGRLVKEGMGDREVRRRVEGFVKAGV